MACDRPTLFDEDAVAPTKARRNPRRVPVQRERPQLHLPVFAGDPIGAEEARLEEFAAEHRPRTRAECQQEARPCPWVSCMWHLYHDRFELFATIIDMIDLPDARDGDEVTRPGLEAAVQAAVRRTVRAEAQDEESDGDEDRVMATSTTGKRKPEDRVPPDAIVFERLRTKILSGPWPTCALDVADQVKAAGGELVQEDAAELTGITREAIRLMQARVAGHVASDEGMRDFLEGITSAEKIEDARAQRINWYGE